MKKIYHFLFSTSLKHKILLLKEKLFFDKDGHFTVLFRLIKKVVNIDKNYIILDIGAFDGNSSILFTKTFPNYKITAFEPNETSYNIAIKNTKSFKNIEVKKIALSDKSDIAEFNITKNAVSSSLNSISDILSKESGYKDELSVVKKITVETKPLDDYKINTEILFIKIDTQGNELRVLEGAKNTLKNTLFVLVEMSNHNIYANGCKYFEVDNWFRNNGFKLVDIIILTRKKGIIVTEFDAIYANVNKVSL